MADAIVIKKYGNSNVLNLEKINVADPEEDELFIRQTAVGVNYHDVYVRSGLYKTLRLPGIPGCEAAGIVEKAGKKVKGFKEGDRVTYITSDYGAYATHRVINRKLAIKIPNSISDELIATNFLRAMTVEMLVSKVTKLGKNKTILVTAATGGVGRLICQWASKIGVTVIGSVSSEEKIKLGEANGCTKVLLAGKTNFVKAVLDLTNGKGVDVVFDSVGADTFDDSLDVLAPCGHLVNFGQSSGNVRPILMTTLAQKSLTVSRPILFHYLKHRTVYEQMAGAVLEAFENRQLVVSNMECHSLENAREAHDALESRRGGGSIYLKP